MARSPDGLQIKSAPRGNEVEVNLKVNPASDLGFQITGGTDEPRKNGDTGILISKINPGSVAEKCGQLCIGDRILCVNDRMLENVTHDQVIALFRIARLKSQDGTIRMVISKKVEKPNTLSLNVSSMTKQPSNISLASQNLSQVSTAASTPLPSPVPTNVLQGLYHLYKDSQFTDCTLVAGPRNAQSTYRVHRCVLAANSPVFKDMLLSSEQQQSRSTIRSADDNNVEILVKDVPPEVAEMVVEFLYTGQLPTSCALSVYLLILSTAAKYRIDGLHLQCEKILCGLVDADCIGELMLVAHRYHCGTLKKECLDEFEKLIPMIYSSEGWRQLKERDHELAISTLEALTHRMQQKLAEDGRTAKKAKLEPNGPYAGSSGTTYRTGNL